MSDAVREMVMSRVNATAIARTAVEQGSLRPLRHAGFEKVCEGVTTFPEVVRATKL